VALIRVRGAANHLTKKSLGTRISVKKAVFPTFLVVDNNRKANLRIVGPHGVRGSSSKTDHVPLLVWWTINRFSIVNVRDHGFTCDRLKGKDNRNEFWQSRAGSKKSNDR